jgi:hypothetical protein
MSVLGDIVSAIFHRSASPASAAPAGGSSPQTKPAAEAAPTPKGAPVDLNDSASMNVWLYKQVMIKLAENGGKVPNELGA